MQSSISELELFQIEGDIWRNSFFSPFSVSTRKTWGTHPPLNPLERMSGKIISTQRVGGYVKGIVSEICVLRGPFTVKSHIIWNTSTFFGGFFEDFFGNAKKILGRPRISCEVHSQRRGYESRGRGVPKLGKPQVPGGWMGEVRLGGSGRRVFPETNEWLQLKMAEVGFFYIFLFGANLPNFRGYATCSF